MAFDTGNTSEKSNVHSPSQTVAPLSIETGHKDMIHDIQVDYYGKTVATASADHTVRLFHVVRDKYFPLAVLIGHEGPVWRVSWAHPKYGSILASCGYDRKLIIWQMLPQKNNPWAQVFSDQSVGSMNCVQFAPVDYGLQCIAGSSDGTISHYIFQKGNQPNNQWKKQSNFEAHNGGVNGVSWCPSSGSAVLSAPSKTNPNVGSVTKKFASCGCDNIIKIWEWNIELSHWVTITKLSQHTDWVRDVAWAPIPGAHSHGIVASCSEDKSVIIWKQKGDEWKSSAQIKLLDRVWSVSWSELGNILAVASGENQVQLFKEGIDGKWHDVSKVNPSK